VTIGAYDGVHLGHQAVIAEVRRMAGERAGGPLETAVVTFDRHPAMVVRPESAPLLLTDLDQKLELLATTGLDHAVVLHFDEARSKESAEDFVQEVLVDCLAARLVVVGEDFHFGRERKGDVALLERMGADLGFDVDGLDLVGMLQERATVAVDVDAMHLARQARRDELLALETARPGVIDWLDEAAALDLDVAIASSSPHSWVGPHLERLDLRHHFTHVACYAEGLNAKPAPDLYLAACAALGVAPNEAIAVEDSPNGINAARAAGLFCVAVPNQITAQFDISHADLVLPSLAESTLGDVITRIG
jgi:HAD superfamily hydrolase (TIGR01509 family)